ESAKVPGLQRNIACCAAPGRRNHSFRSNRRISTFPHTPFLWNGSARLNFSADARSGASSTIRLPIECAPSSETSGPPTVMATPKSFALLRCATWALCTLLRLSAASGLSSVNTENNIIASLIDLHHFPFPAHSRAGGNPLLDPRFPPTRSALRRTHNPPE